MASNLPEQLAALSAVEVAGPDGLFYDRPAGRK